jgi:hypothetical protein
MNYILFQNKAYEITGIKITREGYRLLLVHDFPGASKSGYIMEHRLIMTLCLQRPLYDNEMVHHINGDKTDNSIKNLELTNWGEHTAKHHMGTKRKLSTRLKLSQKAKERFLDPKSHPFYKNIDPIELKQLHDSGWLVKDICHRYGICKRTFYNKINELKGA